MRESRNIIRDIVGEYRFTNLSLKMGNKRRFFGEVLRNDIMKRKWVIEGLLEIDSIENYFIVLSELDWIFHSYYSGIIDGHIPRYVRASISALSSMVDSIVRIARKRNMDILVVSDHGFRVYDKMVCINDILRRMGYARGISIRKISKKSKDSSLKLLGSKERTIRDMMIHHLLLVAYSLRTFTPFSDRIYRYVVRSDYRLLVENDRSKAFALMNIPAFFIAVSKHVKEKEAIAMEIVNRLRRLRDRYGRRVLSLVARREEMYWGPYVGLAPHICIYGNINAGYLTSAILTGSPVIHKRMNYHDFDAIFIMWRRDIEPRNLGTISIYDIAPTIMSLTGIPTQKGIDGEPLINNNTRQQDYTRQWSILRRMYKRR